MYKYFLHIVKVKFFYIHACDNTIRAFNRSLNMLQLNSCAIVLLNAPKSTYFRLFYIYLHRYAQCLAYIYLHRYATH